MKPISTSETGDIRHLAQSLAYSTYTNFCLTRTKVYKSSTYNYAKYCSVFAIMDYLWWEIQPPAIWSTKLKQKCPPPLLKGEYWPSAGWGGGWSFNLLMGPEDKASASEKQRAGSKTPASPWKSQESFVSFQRSVMWWSEGEGKGFLWEIKTSSLNNVRSKFILSSSVVSPSQGI